MNTTAILRARAAMAHSDDVFDAAERRIANMVTVHVAPTLKPCCSVPIMHPSHAWTCENWG